VKPIAEQSDRKAAFTPLEQKPHPLGVVKKRGCALRSHPSFLTGFTIIELMTVMSVIIILIGLLVPGLNALKQYARKVTQKNQFYAIGVALETFNAEWDGYQPSTAVGKNGQPYCGAMKLCEAMMGQDLLGFHPDASFTWPDNVYTNKVDLSSRRKYLPPGKANAYKLVDLYGPGGVGTTFTGDEYVLCDVYTNVEHLSTGKLVGMPILYYKASASLAPKMYDYADNEALVVLGKPWEGGTPHDEFNPTRFLDQIKNEEIWENSNQTIYRPCRADSYILLSAGHDGEYGTDDDMFNF